MHLVFAEQPSRRDGVSAVFEFGAVLAQLKSAAISTSHVPNAHWLVRSFFATDAVAHRNDGATSSATHSNLDRLLPSLSVHERCSIRPVTVTRQPFSSDSAQFSARLSHATQSKKCVTSSSPRLRFSAMVKLATGLPPGVKRNSGAAVRLPVTVNVLI